MLARAIPSIIPTRRISITTGSVQVVDSVFIDSIRSRLYIVDIESVDGLKHSFEMFSKIMETNIEFTRYAMLGDEIDYSVSMNIENNDMIFRMQNNHIADFEVYLKII